MSENKYVRMMRQQPQRCHRQALYWPLHSVTRDGWEREVVEWQAAADAFEALVEAAQRVIAEADDYDYCLMTVDRHTVGELLVALKKAKGEE